MFANERSIAWGISQKLAGAGAELAFTYLGDALKKRVVPLAKSLNSEFTLSCNVENKEEVIKLFEDIKAKWGQRRAGRVIWLKMRVSRMGQIARYI